MEITSSMQVLMETAGTAQGSLLMQLVLVKGPHLNRQKRRAARGRRGLGQGAWRSGRVDVWTM